MGQTASKIVKLGPQPNAISARPREDIQHLVPINDDQEEQLWDAAVASSLDTFREMAEKARANRRAGRTQKIDS